MLQPSYISAIFLTAKLHRVCAERQASPSLHSQESHPVQAVGLCHLPPLRVHSLHRHHVQHHLPCHEVLQAAQGVHRAVGRAQHPLHCIFHTGVYRQTRGFQIQGEIYKQKTITCLI